MAAVDELITEHIDIWTSAVKRKSSAGRGGGKKVELYGVKKLRELILDLAVRGLLVPQDPEDEPASVLLERIAAEKAELVKTKAIKKQKPLPLVSDKEKRFTIPTGWIWARLVDSYDVRDGTHDTPKYVDQGYPLITSKNLSKGYLDFSNIKYISQDDHQKIVDRSKVDRNDILFAMIGSIGNPILVDTDREFSIKNVALFKYYSGTNSSPEFLLLFLKFAEHVFRREASGAVQSFVSLGKIRGFPIGLPPLPEQHRIVAKVDELMALCDQLEQQTEASLTAHQTLVQTLLDALTQAAASQPNNPQSATDAPTPFEQAWSRLAEHFDTVFTTEDSIEQLKQTILQLAVMGKLVPQDPNDEPANVLLERIAAEKVELVKAKKIKKQKALPEIVEDEKPFALQKGWEWVRFDDISKNEKNALKAGPFGSALKKSFYVKSGYKIYGQEQVISGDENFGDYYVDREKYLSLESCKVEPGDILISLVGTIGRVLIVSDHAAPGIINPRLVKLSLNNDIDRDYIRIILGSRLIKKELSEKSHGSTMDVLNLGLLRKLQFPLPPVPEQNRIVTKVNELVSQCDLLKDHLKIIQTTRLQLAVAVTDSHSDNSCQGSHSKNGVKAKARKIK